MMVGWEWRWEGPKQEAKLNPNFLAWLFRLTYCLLPIYRQAPLLLFVTTTTPLM